MDFPQFYPPFQGVLERIWNTDKVRFDRILFDLTNSILTRAYREGIGSVSTDLNAQDHLLTSLQEANISRYAAAKTAREIMDLNRLANKATNFEEFLKESQAIGIKYNQSWLKAEYQTGVTAGQTSRDYYNQLNTQEVFPYVMFDTVGDGRVRDEHAKLDGTIVKVGSKQHDFLNPPLGYNCRCRFRQMTESEVGDAKLKSKEELIDVLKSQKVGKQTAYDIVNKYGFDTNGAKTGEVFKKAQFFIPNFKETGLSHSDYNLDGYTTIKQAKSAYFSSTSNKQQWFDERVGANQLTNGDSIRLTDYRKRPVLWPKKTYKFDDPNTAAQVINDPDEVWLIKNGKTYSRNYIKMYNNQAIRVQVDFDLKENEFIKTAKFEDNIDGYRKGVLLQSK